MLKIHGARMIGNSCLVLLSIFEPKQREPLPCEKFPNAPDPSYLSVCNIILFLVLICLRICDLNEEILKKTLMSVSSLIVGPASLKEISSEIRFYR